MNKRQYNKWLKKEVKKIRERNKDKDIITRTKELANEFKRHM